MSWLIPRDELTSEQLRAVELGSREHCVILGAPGSGKTQILLHRARFLCDELAVKPGRFHIFVFTNVLKNYIRTALIDLDLPDDCVSTIDDWCMQLYKREINKTVPWDKKDRAPDYAAVRKAVHNLVKDRRPFDFILVDEGQDLDADKFALLKDLSSHLTVAMDHKQQIYEDGSGEAEVIHALGLRRGNLTLLDAFRCCPYIVRIASELIPNSAERAALLNQTRTSQTGIQTPLLYEANDFEDEKSKLIEVLRERQLVDRTIGILFPQNRQVEGFAHGLREKGIPVETRKNGLNFANAIPKLLTIHSAKGLTFDSVLLPRLVPASFSGVLDGWAERLLYVGITRATKWVYLSTTAGKALPALTKIRALAELKPPVVALGRPTPVSSIRPTATATAADDLLDLL